MDKFKKVGNKLLKSQGLEALSASVIAAVCGLIVGLIIMLIVNPSQAFAGLGSILKGGFNGGFAGVGNVLYYAAPIIMTGLSVGFAFKTGLFNIGAPGQYTMGLFCSLYVSFMFQNVIPSSMLWVCALLAGMIGGMIWGAIPGLFKAYLNVNEVITSIMTNYIGMFLVDMLVKGNITMFNINEARTRAMPESANIPKFGLDSIFPGSTVNGGIIIAAIIAVLIYIVLFKTTFGFELRACGSNKTGAKYAGVNEKRTIVMSMIIAGGLAGIGGALLIQAGASNTYEPVNVLAVNGFNGIAVALLGASNPIGIVFAGAFFAHLQRGGFYLQLQNFKPEIIDIIIGVIIYFSSFALIIKSLFPQLFTFLKFKKNIEDTTAKTVEKTIEVEIEKNTNDKSGEV